MPTASSPLNSLPPSPVLGADTLPFADLFVPFVEASLDRVEARLPDGMHSLSHAARRDLAQDLTQRLSEAVREGVHPLYERARTHIQREAPLLVLDPSGRALYRSFVASVYASDFRALFEPAPVLEHIVDTIRDQWVDAACEVLTAWQTDRTCLEKHFGLCARRLAGIAGSQSDPHDGGRTVWILRFASGERLVYKPRSLAPEAALHTWLKRVDPTLATTQPRILERESYGWCAFVEPRPCRSEAAVRTFYRRTGRLLAVATVLGLSDLHAENVVATAAGPVVLDAETLAGPELRPPASAEAQTATDPAVHAANQRIEDSVMATGLLPAWHVLDGGRPYDASALGRGTRTPTPLQQRVWAAVNQDAMAPVVRESRPAPAGNTVYRGDAPVAPHAYLDDLVEGFRDAYHTLCAEREALLAPGGLVDSLADVPTRVLVRPTRTYHRLRLRALRPDALQSEAAWTAQHARLGGAALDPRWAPVIAAEQAALARCDVPAFRTAAGADTLVLPSSDAHAASDAPPDAADVLVRSGIERVRMRLAAMGPDDETRQVAWIRAAFVARTEPVVRQPVPLPRLPEDPSTAGPPTPEAKTQAAHLAATAVRSEDRATWIGLHVHPEADVWTLGPLPPALAGGLGGTVLHLAETAIRAGRPDWIALARAARRTLQAEADRMADDDADAWATGRRGVAYALAVSGRWLGESNVDPEAWRGAPAAIPVAVRGEGQRSLVHETI